MSPSNPEVSDRIRLRPRRGARALALFQIAMALLTPLIVTYLIVANVNDTHRFHASDSKARYVACDATNESNVVLVTVLKPLVADSAGGRAALVTLEAAFEKRDAKCRAAAANAARNS